MRLCSLELAETEPPIQRHSAIGVLCFETDWYLAGFRALNHAAQELRADALLLKERRDDKFMDLNLIAAVFNARVTAGDAVATDDFKQPWIPIVAEELILRLFFPHSILSYDNIIVGMMMHRAGKVRIYFKCGARGYVHNASGLHKAAERVGVQLPRARCTGLHQKTNDLAREAVNCNARLCEKYSAAPLEH